MGLETGTYIDDLIATNPPGTDDRSTADDHIRLLKSTILATFPNITGAVTPTHTELNYVGGVTSGIQAQLNTKSTSASPTFTGTITGPSGTWDAGGLDLASGDTYAIAGTDVLNATTLGTAVVNSSLTSLGTIASLVATTADINAGTFDGIVGGTTPAAGSFTTINASGTITGDLTGDVTGNADTSTNTTGNAATVTTNANLTGEVTSTGNAALLGSFASARLKAALTDETGAGAAVFADSPALLTPAVTGNFSTAIGSDSTVSDSVGDLRDNTAAFSGFSGLTTAHDTPTDNYILINTGACSDATGAVIMTLSSILTKRIDADWAVGDNLGGLAAGARSVADTPNASTWYHYFLIKSSGGTVDAGWDTATNASNLLTDSGYTYYRRIASHYVNASNNIDAYTQRGDRFIWTVPINAKNGAASLTEAAITLRSPPDTEAQIQYNYDAQSPSRVIRIYPTFVTNQTPNTTYQTGTSVVDESISGVMYIDSDSSSQINHRATFGSTLVVNTLGWRDNRGRLS